MGISHSTSFGQVRRPVLFGLLALSILPMGCVTVGDWWQGRKQTEPKKVPKATRMMIYWAPNVSFAPDAHQNGRPVPGFAGRMYLFTSEMKTPLPANGSLTVTVHDPKQRDEKGDYKAIEQWTISPKSLREQQSSDFVGIGVSLFLPWNSYHPDAREVVLRAKYVTAEGVPLFYDSGLMRLGSMRVVKAPTIHKSTELPQGAEQNVERSRMRIQIPAGPPPR